MNASGQPFHVDRFVVAGGGGTSSGGIWSVSGTIGQAGVGNMSSAFWSVESGFWPGLEPGAANLLVNGSFEFGVFVNGNGANDTMQLYPGATNILGWTVTGSAGLDLSWIGPTNNYGLTAADGGYFLDVTGYHDSAPSDGISQTFATTVGQPYHVSFELGSDQSYDSAFNGNGGVFLPPSVLVSINGIATYTASNNFPGLSSYWHTWGFDFTATSAQTTINFSGNNSVKLDYIGLDNVIVTAGTQPQTYDAVGDFSSGTNPNGTWSYGSLSAFTDGAFSLFTTSVPLTGFTGSGQVWYNGGSAQGGVVVKNTSNGTIDGPSSSPTVFLPTNFLDVDGVGAIACVRWTAPAAGYYNITGSFQRIDDQPAAVNIEILQNGTNQLFVSNYFTGFNNVAPFSLSNISLTAGAVLDFAESCPVSPHNDGTGLAAIIVTTNLVGQASSLPDYYWKFDETNGTTAFPSAGSINGTLEGGAMFAPGMGINGGAVQFNPITDDIVVFTNFDFSSSFTVQAWVKLNRGDTAPYIPASQHYTGINDGMFLAINNTGDPGVDSSYVNRAHLYVSGVPTGPSITSVNDGQWHQLVGVCSYNSGLGSRTLQLFVDGTLESSGSLGAYTGNSVPFIAGGVSQNGLPQNGYRGLIDEVALYFSALNANQIQSLYLDTLPPTLSISLSPPNVQLLWNSRPTKMYSLQSSTNLAIANPWTTLGAPIQGNGTTNYTTAPYSGQTTFYRLMVAP
jgi:hypothetical protein